MANKSTVTRINRNEFVNNHSVETLRVLAAIRKQEAGVEVDVPVSRASAAAYKANLNRGTYRPYVGPNFRNDRLNLINCNR